ncbi:hypothetical protein [Pelagibius sp.]|uniref:hypothetical protein n=1 Tax=Pelagibius sp. TaxID=1931238 RepID=UPI003B506DD0
MLAIAGCETRKAQEAGQQLDGYVETMWEIAVALENAAGGDASYRIVPIVLAAHPQGTVLPQLSEDRPAARSMTEACLFDKATQNQEPVQWGSLPTMTMKRGFNAGASVPESVHPVLAIIGSPGLSINLSDEGTIALSDIAGRDVSDNYVNAKLADADCQSAIGNRPAFLVRGQVLAELDIRSNTVNEGKLDISNISSEDYVLKIDDSGGYELESREQLPRFLILTTISEGLSARVQRSAGDNLIQRPSDDEIETFKSSLKEWEEWQQQ